MAAQGINIDRLGAIRQHLYAHGRSTNQDLIAATGASLATLRRDLSRLEREGVIERLHGGAQLASGSSVEVAFEQREKENLQAKRAIANAAYECLKPHTTIFLDSATTVLQLAQRLRIAPLPITVFTNWLAAARELINVAKIKVMLLGGQLRAENASIVGTYAESMLDRLWFDQLFLGASAISADGTIYSIDLSEATLNSKMIARSAERFVLVDASKFGHMATYAVGPISDATQVIVDAAISSEWQQRLTNLRINLTVVRNADEPGR
jgi:DeoR/GlpR family transcriptional regulator of sugar metabolism